MSLTAQTKATFTFTHSFTFNFLLRWRFVLFLGLPTLRTRRLHVNSVFFDSVLFDSPSSARAHVGSNFLIYFSFCLSYLFNVFSFFSWPFANHLFMLLAPPTDLFRYRWDPQLAAGPLQHTPLLDSNLQPRCRPFGSSLVCALSTPTQPLW